MRPYLALLLLTACGADKDRDNRCAGSLEAGEVRVIADDFDVDGTVGTEGVAFSPDGRLFVGGSGINAGSGFVAEVFADGAWDIVATVPHSVGLAWANEGLLVATTDTGDGTAGVIAVDVDTGRTGVFATGLEGSNFLAVTPWGTLLVSSPSGTTLQEIRGGRAKEWAKGVPSPNGIAFDAAGTTAWVANTYDTPSVVTAIDVVGESAGSVGVLATLPDASTQDGVAVDADDNLYVVNNLPGTIARIAPDGSWEIAAEGVDFGASLAFGLGDWDRCSVIATSLFSPELYQVGLGHPGAAPRMTLSR